MSCHFVSEQWIAADLDRVFRFFADPQNLPLISPPQAGVRLVSLRLLPPLGVPEGELLAGPGSEIVVSVLILPWLPFRAKWRARIRAFEYDRHFRYFEDDQVSGPFRLWKHRHEFEPAVRNGQNGTVVRDKVEYCVGFGPLGALADVLFVRRMLKQMFSWRQQATERILSSAT
jgi:ligand-binding SRPBCC domain-containing protein